LAVTQSGVTSVAAHRIFDSYGNLVSSVNQSTGEAAAVACLFGYTGKAFDNATGLQNNLNRWYDSTVGRWLSEDPSGFDGGQTNVCVYCGNSPMNGTDPTGEATLYEFVFHLYERKEKDSLKRAIDTGILPSDVENFARLLLKRLSGQKIAPTESPLWKGAKPFQPRVKMNGLSGKDRLYYKWDYTHSDIEVYDSKGNNLGSMDPFTGKMTKPPVTGRTL